MNAEAPIVGRGPLLAVGIILIIAGIAAIAMPLVATLAIELLIGWIFVLTGILQMVYSFWSKMWGRFSLRFLTGLLYLAAGVLLLVYPLRGALTLTLLLALLFILEGLCKVIASALNSAMPNWGWMFFSGILALIIGGLIWAQWPSSAAWAIGLLAGVNILFRGWALTMNALACPQD